MLLEELQSSELVHDVNFILIVKQLAIFFFCVAELVVKGSEREEISLYNQSTQRLSHYNQFIWH